MKKSLVKIFLFTFFMTVLSFSQGIVINEIMSSNSSTYADETGQYSDWIELYNNSSNTINIGGYFLSDDDAQPLKWTIPNGNIPAHQFLVIFASGNNRTTDFQHLHTNFSIKASGEPILLSNASGTLIDRVDAAEILSDNSIGRQSDGSTNWLYFAAGQPTPGTSNNFATGMQGLTDVPVFSVSGGFYSGSVSVSIIISTPQTTVHYTTNGAEPDINSTVYVSPVAITKTTVLRAKAFRTGFLPSSTVTNTYLINERNTLPVISLSTDPSNFFDQNTGIYVSGANAKAPNSDNPDTNANYWKDWERPVHIEMYEPNGTLGFSIDAGVKINGGYSREYPQKSLSIHAKGEYGYSSIKYKIFPDLNINEFQTINLRNSGQDWGHTMFRDALEESLIKGSGLDTRAYRPAILFLNGQYYGIYNIREKENEHFLASHHGVDPKNVIRVQLDGEAEQGDASDYNAMYNYISNNDMSISSNYEYIKTKMDVDNFISYMVTEIYMNNVDWPGSNLKYWKDNSPSSKWQWIIQDIDFGFGLYDYDNSGAAPDGYKHNTLDFATATNGPDWPNPPWSTIMLRNFLLNQEFKTKFINTFADFTNQYFVPQKIVDKINQMKTVIEPEMPYHQQRWHSGQIGNYKNYPQTISDWNYEVQKMVDFANNRLPYIRNNYVTKFGLSGAANLTVNISQANGGKVKFTSITVDQSNWTGTYFKNVSIPVEAIANPGYTFVGWSGASSSSSNSISITLTGDTTLTANFQPVQGGISDAIVINEINYKSATDVDPDDWVELYNKSSQEVDLSGWIIKDDNDLHIFTITAGTKISANGFLVLCKSSTKFHTVFPNVVKYIGDLSFGLSSSGSLVRLYDYNLNLIDQLTYGVVSPWPSEPNGTGATLALKEPSLDNAIGTNWSASPKPGTPGAVNTLLAGTKISGRVVYENSLLSPMSNVIVNLTPATGSNTVSTISDASGNFTFNNVTSGSYTITASSTKPFPSSFVNATDALIAVRSYAGLVNLSPLKNLAGNVVNDPSGIVNPNDALLILKRYLGLINRFNLNSGWVFQTINVSVSSQDLNGVTVRGLAAGDIDASAGGNF